MTLLTPRFPRAPRRSDTPEVVRRVKVILGGHPDLLDGFNCFLPEVRDAHGSKHQKKLPIPDGGFPCWHLFFVSKCGEGFERQATASFSTQDSAQTQSLRPFVSRGIFSARVKARACRAASAPYSQTDHSPPLPSIYISPFFSPRPPPCLTQPYKFDAVKDAEAKANKVTVQSPQTPEIYKRTGADPLETRVSSASILRGAFAPFPPSFSRRFATDGTPQHTSPPLLFPFFFGWGKKKKPVPVLVQISTLSSLAPI